MSWGHLKRDERGTTLTELLVGMSAGMVVMLGLTILVIGTLHATARVSARVDATQRARLTLNRLLDQLHSACVAPKVSPLMKESTGTEIRFVHATGAAVSPIPTLSVVSLSESGTLTQADYAYKEGVAPFWVFETANPTSTTQLMTGVGPISASQPIFTYYAYSSGQVSATPLPTPVSELDASRTIQVGVAFKTLPAKGASASETDPARIQDSATFRLSASSYNKEAPSLPCQ